MIKSFEIRKVIGLPYLVCTVEPDKDALGEDAWVVYLVEETESTDKPTYRVLPQFGSLYLKPQHIGEAVCLYTLADVQADVWNFLSGSKDPWYKKYRDQFKDIKQEFIALAFS